MARRAKREKTELEQAGPQKIRYHSGVVHYVVPNVEWNAGYELVCSKTAVYIDGDPIGFTNAEVTCRNCQRRAKTKGLI